MAPFFITILHSGSLGGLSRDNFVHAGCQCQSRDFPNLSLILRLIFPRSAGKVWINGIRSGG